MANLSVFATTGSTNTGWLRSYGQPHANAILGTTGNLTLRSGTFMNAGEKRLLGGDYEIMLGFQTYDTSAIPAAAEVTAAELSVYCESDHGGSPYTRYIRANAFGTLTTADWLRGSALSAYSLLSTRTSVTTSAHNVFATSGYFLAAINKSGDTQIMLHDADTMNEVALGLGDDSSTRWSTSSYTGTTRDPFLSIDYSTAVPGAVIFTGAGDMSASGLVKIPGAVAFTGEGDMSAAGIVYRYIRFLAAPRVTTRMAFATHVIVQSPTNEGTANITPEPAAAVRIYRLINIDSGDAALCTAVAAQLIISWGADRVSVQGVIPLDVQLLFKTKIQVVVPEAALDSALILQRKEHDILKSTTSIVCGDIILSDDELLARILDELN